MTLVVLFGGEEGALGFKGCHGGLGGGLGGGGTALRVDGTEGLQGGLEVLELCKRVCVCSKAGSRARRVGF